MTYVKFFDRIASVFLSCKSGIVTADELYKLDTVAERKAEKSLESLIIR